MLIDIQLLKEHKVNTNKTKTHHHHHHTNISHHKAPYFWFKIFSRVELLYKCLLNLDISTK